MDALTITVLAARQPRRAVRHRPGSVYEWCAHCYSNCHSLTPGNIGQSVPAFECRHSGECLSCLEKLEYHDIEVP